MKFKKALALCLSMAMVVGALSACGKTEEKPSESSKSSETPKSSETTPSSSSVTPSSSEEPEDEGITFPLEETVEFEMLAMRQVVGFSINDNEVWKELQKKANIKVNSTDFDNAEFKEKFNVLMAGGEYGDYVLNGTNDPDKYGLDGVYIPLEDLIREYMPNLTALLDEKNAWNFMSATDGHIYSLPMIGPALPETSNAILHINKAWLDKVGMDIPTSYEELYDAWVAFRDKDPNGNGQKDEWPAIFRGGFYNWVGLGALQVYDPNNSHVWNWHVTFDENYQISFYPYTDDYKEFLAWCAKSYQEGLVHPDCFTMDGTQYKAVTMSGNVTGSTLANNGVKNIIPADYVQEYDAVPFFNPEVVGVNNGISKGALSITDKCENPEILCAFYDYMYSYEGGLEYQNGIKDVHWAYDADGVHYHEIKEKTSQYDNPRKFNMTGGASVGLNDGSILLNKTGLDHTDTYYYDALYGQSVAQARNYVKPVLNKEESDAVSVKYADIRSYINTYVTEVITGRKDLDSTWEEFKKTCKDYGADEVVKVVQGIFDRNMGK